MPGMLTIDKGKAVKQVNARDALYCGTVEQPQAKSVV